LLFREHAFTLHLGVFAFRALEGHEDGIAAVLDPCFLHLALALRADSVIFA
jgi:hypothetical protein